MRRKARIGWTVGLVAASLAVLSAGSDAAEEREFPFKKGERVVFLGDSITFAGRYVQYVDAYVQSRFPQRDVEILNLGLPSETVSGESEPDHPYPRPNVHERLERVMAKTKPDVVVACYGMNDGIYYPFSKTRFAAYQAGIRSLTAKIRGAGARVILVTPSIFDAQPVRARTLPITAPKFSWMAPYAQYDEVLANYSRWLLTLRDESIPVVDARATISGYLTAARAEDPSTILAGDGVHPNPSGEWLLAQAVLEGLGAPQAVDTAVVDAERYTGEGVDQVRRKDYGVDIRWTTRIPLPLDPEWDPKLAERVRLTDRLNRHRLVVRRLPGTRYSLFEGLSKVGEVSGSDLENGVDLQRFPALTTNRRAAELLSLVRERERLLGLAWLTECGHKRPDTLVGLPLAEAEAKAAPLTRRIRELTRPVTLSLRLSREQ